MEGIHFVTDEKGHKIAVQIDLERYRELWEDFYDALTIEQRRSDQRLPLREVKKRLARASKLRG
ncbi:MAG TPA: hypothetical protein VGS96_17590 [Thermoanaerobaculia bacterium]|nr:hypothetical protein [Thermoanaerobaculia bacterium]